MLFVLGIALFAFYQKFFLGTDYNNRCTLGFLRLHEYNTKEDKDEKNTDIRR